MSYTDDELIETLDFLRGLVSGEHYVRFDHLPAAKLVALFDRLTDSGLWGRIAAKANHERRLTEEKCDAKDREIRAKDREIVELTNELASVRFRWKEANDTLGPVIDENEELKAKIEKLEAVDWCGPEGEPCGPDCGGTIDMLRRQLDKAWREERERAEANFTERERLVAENYAELGLAADAYKEGLRKVEEERDELKKRVPELEELEGEIAELRFAVGSMSEVLDALFEWMKTFGPWNDGDPHHIGEGGPLGNLYNAGVRLVRSRQ